MQYDIRNLMKAARVLNNNEPFMGERLLHRLLDKTYFAHILPPLPERDEKFGERAEAELATLLGKGSDALGAVHGWFDQLRDGPKSKS
jgi:oleate hydratase